MKHIIRKKWTLPLLLGGTLTMFCGQAIAQSPAPISIRDTVLSTLNYSPDIKSFQEYRQAADHDVSRARSGWLPRVDARAAWGVEQWSNDTTRRSARTRGIGQNDEGFYERSEASIVVQQTIWDGLATWNRYKIGTTKLDSAAYRLLDNSEAAALDAILAHIEVYRQRRLVALSELNVQNHRDILASQQERLSVGASSMADVTQTQARLARAQASLTETRSALEQAMAEYKRLTGMEAIELVAPAATFEAYPSMDAVLADSQTLNPKIKALQSDIETAKHQVELDKANFHPQIYVEVGPSYKWQVEGSQTYEWGTGVMLRASWNLFDGFYDYYNVKGDVARMRQTREQLKSQADSLAQESEATWSALLSARDQSKYFAVAVENTTQTRNAYLEQFNVGQRSLLDVLDSENELYSSSMQLVTAKLNEVAATYRLKALGGQLLASFDIDRNSLNIDADAREKRRQQGIPEPRIVSRQETVVQEASYHGDGAVVALGE